MDKYIQSQDGFDIHYIVSNARLTAIVFVHGWLGNAEWWNGQRDYFQDNYTVVQIDLPGNGKSEKGRTEWSAEQYAYDIKAVVDQLGSENVVLVGHSMSGPYTLQASLLLPRVKLVVLVDTIKNLDQMMNYQQAQELLFRNYRENFKNAVENMLPNFLFAKETPPAIREQLQKEFLQHDVDFAIQSLEPLYKMDVRSIADKVRVPVRAINSNYTPTNVNSIRRHIIDYAMTGLDGSGHYPMLERPDAFNRALAEILKGVLL